MGISKVVSYVYIIIRDEPIHIFVNRSDLRYRGFNIGISDSDPMFEIFRGYAIVNPVRH